MSDELKPCPWCKNTIGSGLSERSGRGCPDEVCCPHHTEWMTHDEWNRRSPAGGQEAEDAARYRWLRARLNGEVPRAVSFGGQLLNFDHLDKRIDDARMAMKKEIDK